MQPIRWVRQFIVICIAIGSAGLLASVATAHPLSISYSSFTIGEQEVSTFFRLPLDDVDLLFRLDQNLDNKISDPELQKADVPIQDYLQTHASITVNGIVLVGKLQKLGFWEDKGGYPYIEANVSYQSTSTIDKLNVSVNVLTDLYPDHRNLAEFILGDQREEHVFHRGTTWSGTREIGRSWTTARDFFVLGVEHIVTGYDHILFLLGLLLVASGLRSFVIIVTSFTVAHSITLALGVLGWVQPAAQAVEIMIALSIAYVGLENLLFKEVKYRWLLTFVFGLAHGFGFAGILQNMDLQREGLLLGLLTFNLGVEVGQLLIVALFWPVLLQLAKSSHREWIVRIVSAIILLFGVFWLVERTIWV